ncbi:2-C-methyl-D-erythritol 4-phosphate cytidylyltransferase [Mycobacterium sp. pV006]|uniref:2-C-methyl-D-erythritol 4-phosphate cytidylyltransferase n=1 Tax=Mycobacterium sp. pV006 TaxID=3238983 RepID=UPI00351AD04B
MTAIVPVPAEVVGRHDALLTPVGDRSPLQLIVDTLRTAGPVTLAVVPALSAAVAETLGTGRDPDLRMIVTEPDADRGACLAAGLPANTGGVVLVHDIAWPVFDPVMCRRVTAALAAGAHVVVPTRAVTDSVKTVDDTGAVTGTVDRSRLRTAQYPRGFDAAKLAMLLDARETPFDELTAAIDAGIPVVEVEGDERAVRTDLPRDTGYLRAVIAARSADR